MTEEEKKAIEDMNRFANSIDMSCVSARQMQIVLNLIEKLSKENEQLRTEVNSLKKELKQKDKIIDLMAEDIDGFQMECNRYFKDKEEVKQYFINKAKKIK
jgi:hypothetical protein